jgi:hypothetical protein
MVIDSSTVALPDNQEMREEFGNSSNQYGELTPHARLTIVYDLLNCLILNEHVQAINRQRKHNYKVNKNISWGGVEGYAGHFIFRVKYLIHFSYP